MRNPFRRYRTVHCTTRGCGAVTRVWQTVKLDGQRVGQCWPCGNYFPARRRKMMDS